MIYIDILSILHVLFLGVMFVGFWTYADYYTKIPKEYVTIYVQTLFGICGATAYFFLMSWIANIYTDALHYAFVFLKILASLQIVVLLSFVLGLMFIKSRKYFKNKRRVRN